MPREKSERKKGERRLEILRALAGILESPRWEKITTAALAEKLDVSEAALYRHFASKAQMYEGLIEFIESSIFSLANRIAEEQANARGQAPKLIETLLAFGEANPGMVRVLTGEALVGEHERLQQRINRFFDRFEATLKQSLKLAASLDAGDPLGVTGNPEDVAGDPGGVAVTPGGAAGTQASATGDPAAHAEALVRYAIGSLHAYSRGGFAGKPSAALAAHWPYVG